MVGRGTVTKPSRSDEVLDAHQHLQITNQIRDQFDSLAPKRPAKPNRSESDTAHETATISSADHNNIPEFEKLRSLQSQSHVLFSTEVSGMSQDEFVETQYYEELDSIDKQHHTTGSGFIRAMTEEHSGGDGIQLFGAHGGAAAGSVVTGYRSNPATNEWTPNLGDDQVFLASKPNRSEGC